MKQEKQGACAVALLDVLGARKDDVEMMGRVYEQVETLRGIMERIVDQLRRDAACVPEEFHEPQFMIFGDTVQFLWQLDDQQKYLPVVGNALGHVFVDALQEGIPLRGALSFGHAVYDDRVAVGPAVSDAAGWYEEANALAVVVTPRTGLILDVYDRQNTQLVSQAFATFDFALKQAQTRQQLWTVAWPAVLRERCLASGIPEADIRPRLLTTLHSLFTMPRGTETKYYEALRFYDHCAQQWAAQ